MMSLSQQCSISLSALLADFVAQDNCPNVDIKGITLDSRQVQAGDLFIAIKGAEADGTAFIPQAIERGAVAILVEKEQALEPQVNNSVPIIGVENLAEYVSDIAGVFYAHPSKQMALTAITGTNGKTTCAHLYAELVDRLNK